MQDKTGHQSLPYHLLAPFKRTTPKGIALVVHGLNLNPERMTPICDLLREEGLLVIRLSLRGHGHNFADSEHQSEEKARLCSFKKVDQEIWIAEVEQAYEAARQQAEHFGCSIYFIGYSLGGLLGCRMLISATKPLFEKMVLFAPALVTRFGLRSLLKPMRIFPGLVIPSLAPKNYRANDGTPIAAYLALQDLSRAFNTNDSSQLNIPTLVFTHQADELISPKKITHLIHMRRLTNWCFHLLDHKNDGPKPPFYHLIIDEPSVGAKNWSFIKQTIKEHLTGPSPHHN